MKYTIVLFGTLLLGALALISFGKSKSDPIITPQPSIDNYESMWKDFNKHLENQLPESAEKVLNEIEATALKDQNQIQLLKTILYRQKVMALTVEEDYQEAYLAYAMTKFDQLDDVSKAVLHCEIARNYADYLNANEYSIIENLPIDGDIDQVAMKYWDKQRFLNLIDQHFSEALKPVEALKTTLTELYTPLYESSSHTYYVKYEPTMYEFLFHRVANYYKEQCTADDIETEWKTEDWWLRDKDFVKVKLGDSEKPIIRCLKIFQELIAFNMKDNPETCLYNDYKRYSFLNGIFLDHDRYQEAMRTLMKQYPQSKQYPDLANELAVSLMEQYQDHSDDSSYFDNYRKAVEICQQAIADDPDHASACKSTLKRLTEPHFRISFNQVMLPNESTPALLSYKNMEHLGYQIYKVKESELDALNELREDELIENLKKRKAVATKLLDLPAETDYREHSAIIALPELDRGIYYLLADAVVLQFQVSNLGFIMDPKEQCLDMVVVDRKTGHPESGVTIEVFRRVWNYQRRKYETKTVATLKSDQDGKAQLKETIGSESFMINLRKGDDALLCHTGYWRIPSKKGETKPHDVTQLFTDRAIYRPGQTVYFKGIAVHHDNGNQTLATQLKETIRLLDANWQEVAKATFTTDDYGAFDGSFVIPTDLMNGFFRLNGSYGSTAIRVEEYKRPTFEVNFESVKDQYKLNEDVTVRGSVDAYAGFGLDDVKYTYRVVRKTHFPWRCWWWWYPVVEDEQVGFGEARTDENGQFAITFNLKPSLKTKPEQQPVFTYEIEVTATSKQGETHSDTYSIRAGYNKVALGTDIPSLAEQSKLKDYYVTVTNMSGQPAKSRVSRKIYRFDEDQAFDYRTVFNEWQHESIDRQLYSDEELQALFPVYSFHSTAHQMQHKQLVFDDEVTVDDKTLLYPGKKTLAPGRYYIELKSLDDPLATIANEFSIFKEESKQMPFKTMHWDHLDKCTAQPGDVIHYQIGSSAKDVKVWLMLCHGNEIRMEQWLTLNNEVKEITYTVKESDRGGLSIQTGFMKENAYQIEHQTIGVPFNNYDLDVTLATMRDKLSPGAEETWTLKVKDFKGNPVSSALLAGMYDASLDEFAPHYWSFGMKPGSVWKQGFSWDALSFTSNQSRTGYYSIAVMFNISLPSDYPFFDLIYYGRYRKGLGRGRFRLDGFVEEEVMLERAEPMAGNVNANMVVAEEEMVEVAKQESSSLETGGEKPETKEESQPSVRENFNETAFFFPRLRSESEGSCTFSFTLPDAITRWNLMTLAYTKDGKTGQFNHSFTASKPVMIMADMPRYMYDTDTLWFVANVINTGDEAVTPTVKLEVFDAATMQPVDIVTSPASVALKNAIQPGRSQEVRWEVAAKYDLSLLAFRFTAYAGSFSDAEQHLLPVLSSEIFMTQTLPITVKAETEKTFDFEAIANPDSHERDHSLTLNFSTNPVWYAVQSLPYLANVKTDRPETAFYVFYANSLSAYIAANVPNLMNYIKKWQIETPDALVSQLEKDEELKAIMLRETPWVLDAKSETEQRSRIVNLFEINTLKQQQTETLALLEKKQKYNGGWPWFEGMPESPYITTYILTGFGKLQKMNTWTAMSSSDQRKAANICQKAVRYVEWDVADTYRKMKKEKEEWSIGGGILSELYALSFFEEQKSDKDFAKAKAYFLDRLSKKKEWTNFNFNNRAKAAMVLYRNGDVKTAELIIQSFKECAQKNEEIGMYWPKHYFSFISHIATHAEIMSAFAEIDKDQDMLDQLRVWLLTQKRTNLWENSASTAEAIYALLLRGSDWFEEGKDVTLSFSGAPISTEGGEAGTGFIQRHWDADEVTEEMRHLTVNNPTGHLVWGGLFRQYFVPIDEVKSDESGFKIRREIFVETVTPNGKLLVPIEKRVLKVGDKLTVKLTFESPQDMSYVFVKDLRAAGFEPLNVISRYHYDDEMSYYQSTTDTDMEFFINFLPKGTHQLEYSMYVTKEGHLSNGYALIQCLYAPEFGAYSDGMRVIVKSEK